jgi:membrane protein DedA with SNARE-associated domain/membrane-associated phospholipid phosphatase
VRVAGLRRHLPLIGVVLAVIVVAVLLNRVVPDIDLQKALHDLSDSLGALTYLVVGAGAFLETGAFVGLVLPGETVIILGGAVAGQGATSIYLTVWIVWFCAWAGDTVSFLIGRRLGREFLLTHGPKLRITRERFERVEGYFKRHGGKTILIGRFIGLVRALAPFTAGSSGMRYRDFVPFSILGTGLWSATFCLIGYFASQSLDQVTKLAGRGTLVFAVIVGVIVGIVAAVRLLREADNRERLAAAMERNRALRPLLRLGEAVQPEARFLAQRLTPGGLGLELTTLLAVLSVAAYVLVAYAVTVSADPGATAGDATAFDIARDIQTGWLTDVAKVVTQLGSALVTLPVTAAAAVFLGVRRRWAELAVLIVATALIYASVPLLKDAIARPRPGGPLVDAAGYAFPSGHAAYSMIYPWLALTLTVRLRPGMAGASSLIATGIALAAAIGLTRVYLRVHYLSDVLGGWALGVAAFALCAAVAMVVTHLRHNSGRDGAARADRS